MISRYGELAVHSLSIIPETDGSFRFENEIEYAQSLTELPRIGIVFELPHSFTDVEYWGRGPQENYRDRCAGYPVGRYRTTVDAMEETYIMPQESGNRTDVRELIVSDGEHRLAIVPESVMEFSISRYSARAKQAAMHRHELKESGRIYLNLDLLQRGVGTESCGPDTLPKYRIPGGVYRFTFRLFWKA